MNVSLTSNFGDSFCPFCDVIVLGLAGATWILEDSENAKYVPNVTIFKKLFDNMTPPSAV